MVMISGGISRELARVNNREQPPHEPIGILQGEQLAQSIRWTKASQSRKKMNFPCIISLLANNLDH